MIESIFGKDNNIIIIILVILLLFSDDFGKGGFEGKGVFLDDNLIILGILIFFLLQDDKGKGGRRYSIEEQESIIDKDICMGCFSNRNNFINFHNQDNDDKCLDYIVNKIFTDEQLRKVIEEIIEIKKLSMMKIDIRDKFIRRIKEETGASIRQLERVLGIGRNIIQKS